MEIKGWAAWGLGLIVTTLGTIRDGTPSALERIAWAFLILLVADFFTGWSKAACYGKLKSRTMRQQTSVKLSQYAGVIAIGYAAQHMTGNWWFTYAAVAACCATEVHSIAENVLSLQKWGVNMRAAAPLLLKIGKLFDEAAVAVPGSPVDSPTPPAESNKDENCT